jgi:ABC-type polysaccharide/polyol phosphate transport system ATPase subunit
VHFVLAIPILAVLLLIERASFGAPIVLLPLLVAIQFAFTLGLGFFLATAHVTFRDTKHLLGVALLLSFYLTPVFYPSDRAPQALSALYRLNPMAILIESYRDVMLHNRVPPSGPLLAVIGLSVVPAGRWIPGVPTRQRTLRGRDRHDCHRSAPSLQAVPREARPTPVDTARGVDARIPHAGTREIFWALRDVDLEVPQGGSLGLIGANGAGKSTLLRLLARVGRPDVGSITVRGRMAALLDLGAGFHDNLSGRDNVMVAGVVSGLTRAEVRRRFDEIVNFAEVTEFIDNPLRTYSSGMRLRLAFAITITVEPEILVVDEVLAVGDRYFQHKCVERITRLRGQGCSLVLCSHDMGLVGSLTDSVAWLDGGRVRSLGPAKDIVSEYSHAVDQRG